MKKKNLQKSIFVLFGRLHLHILLALSVRLLRGFEATRANWEGRKRYISLLRAIQCLIRTLHCIYKLNVGSRP